ncbi:ABC transporter substrate-binding protein [Corynebacterium uberis]|uniref:ABC transporter substrate-binding protein n=1 Tax=Corynebacterium TaxID=1716 RepID=UPI001D0A15D5|nr:MULTISPECIES: ABC transporter substrate-binding protein [Corynebacterium]MCZ9309798.1 ABC transporter substrate-binding protein [Corynebacterium sp. c6VSa_13]UDL73597.1 ABC transporter substrate-binding protein [Corynebacterium uberis]UDL75523.1 ABC transporter substrate-binding protein [Corynebacterium uberis]UDL77736.1 ABC transporter substrate-binding protein [Corynebacterium uberis]UDL80020.1 ABC transporter substrate-binding protein [Corynebacterium uberis]
MNQELSRRRFLQLSGLFAAAAGIATTVSACAPDNPNISGGRGAGGGACAGTPNADGTISAAISYELGTNGFDPMSTSAALTVAANWHTFEGLTELNPADGKVYPALAATLPETSGTEAHITLRDGAAFADGTPVTPADVIFSFERVLDPANKSLYAGFIPFIDKVTAHGDNAVTVHLAHPTGVLAERLAVVKIVPKAAVTANKEAFDSLPMGTGPWRMTDNGGASKVLRFERNEHYTGPKPARAATMEWHVIPDSSTRINALQSGSAQAIDSVPYLNIDQLQATHSVQSVQGFGVLFAMFNNHPSNPFHDVRNRQAFLYALDYDSLITTGLSGQAAAPTSFLQETHPNYHRASTVYSHDPAKAKELFAQTGLKKLRLMCTDHNWVAQCTPLIQESLTAVGMDVDFSERQSADAYNAIDGKPEAFDVLVAPGDPSVFGTDPDLLMRWWYYAPTWADSRMHWMGSPGSDRVRGLLDAGIKATDAAAQQKIWNDTFDALSEEVPLYPLFHRKTPTAWDPSTLIDFEPISLSGLSFIDVATATAGAGS